MVVRSLELAEGTVTLIYTSPGGLKTNLAVASDTGDCFVETDWIDFGDPEGRPDPGPRKKRLRRLRLEVDAGVFTVTLWAKNKLQESPLFTQDYTLTTNTPLTFDPVPPFCRWWKIKIADPQAQERWHWTGLELWADLGGALRE